jgi:hypothetical protein
MNRRTSDKVTKWLGCVLLGVAATCTLAYADESPPSLDDNPRLLAKTAKLKAKQSQVDRQQNANGGDQSAGCGGVDIGNINTPQPIGAPREITVIITGDVINTANKCK